MNRTSCCLTLTLALLGLSPITAADLRPPEYRTEPRSIVAGWDFLTDQNRHRILPDADVPLKIGSVSDSLASIYPSNAPFPSAVAFGDLQYTYDHGGGYIGGAEGNGGVFFTLPNHHERDLFTQMRVQVTYLGEDPPTSVIGSSTILENPKGIEESIIVRVPVQDPSLPSNVSYYYETWWLAPSPPWQQVAVFIPEETILLEVIIDAIDDRVWQIGEGAGIDPKD